ncbi:hypothetical protein PV08_11669 [Exophiala spinifera]|uniref:Cytochrome P450 n=1 Tax=Exophiala spinifera TaxID=91928 RepID=A0A0D2AW51_9EURO|nr:uncharacterized protein PV08_11669 [Exophiala spinifera]KIW10705.1 hypothetical protein PV08_11669 [Exophiala spinifera]
MGIAIVSLSTPTLIVGLLFSLVLYIVYQRYWHPLARYPGPFLASLTNLWEAWYWIPGQTPYRLAKLHAEYGPFVRYGPNKISTVSTEAIQAIYIKGAKNLVKTNWYTPFGHPQFPNVFNERDPEAHAVRRRLLLKTFSPQIVETYEPIIKVHVNRLREHIGTHCDRPQTLNLSKAIYACVCDIIGDLFLSHDYNVQHSGELHRFADDHSMSMLASVSGAWPLVQPFLNLIVLLLPHPRTWKLERWRNTLSYINEVRDRIYQRLKQSSDGQPKRRKDALLRLLETVYYPTEKSEETMSMDQLVAEVFAFLVAGIHPPSASLNVLFWHLLHNPKVMKGVAQEIDEHLLTVSSFEEGFTSAQVDACLPFLKACMKESFRLTPVFSQPLPRYVVDREGLRVGNEVLPQGASLKTSVAVCNHAFHHASGVWGIDSVEFKPSRWQDRHTDALDTNKYLMHFSAGSRQCIGKALALTIMNMVASAILAEFDFELADPTEQGRAENGSFVGKLPAQYSVGISDLTQSVLVNVTKRTQHSDSGRN